jgi:hypothetical protein
MQMQSWQLFPLVIVAAVFGFVLYSRKGMGAAAQQLYGNAMQSLRAAVAQGATPGEAHPICVVATERKMLSARQFYVGLTDRRLVLQEHGKPTRTFDRRAVQLSICEKTFTDSGNMTTTVSRGWELRMSLPDGKHTCRVYAGEGEHAQHVQMLVANVA